MLSDVFLTRVLDWLKNTRFIYKGGVEKALGSRCGALDRVINVSGMVTTPNVRTVDTIEISFFSLLYVHACAWTVNTTV